MDIIFHITLPSIVILNNKGCKKVRHYFEFIFYFQNTVNHKCEKYYSVPLHETIIFSYTKSKRRTKNFIEYILETKLKINKK